MCFHFSFHWSHLLHLYLSHDTLQEYKHFLEEAKKRDHRLLGQAQELFFFHPLRYLYLSTPLWFSLLFDISIQHLRVIMNCWFIYNYAALEAASSFHMVLGYIINWWTFCDSNIEIEDTKRYICYLPNEIVVQFHYFCSLCLTCRCWAQIFTICNFGKLLDMRQTTRRTCSFSR